MENLIYSEKEIKLIKHFGCEKLVDDEYCSPLIMYRLMAEKAFSTNEQSKYSDSLRRCSNALNNCTIYRQTKEFDDLIQLD